eukprot:2508761-Amphidinium_carterae.3
MELTYQRFLIGIIIAQSLPPRVSSMPSFSAASLYSACALPVPTHCQQATLRAGTSASTRNINCQSELLFPSSS